MSLLQTCNNPDNTLRTNDKLQADFGRSMSVEQPCHCMWQCDHDLGCLKNKPKISQIRTEILHAIMENTNAQLAYLDPQFNFIAVNAAYAQGSGYTKEQLIGRNYFELFPNMENLALFQKVRDTGKEIEFIEKPFEYLNQRWRSVTYWNWKLTPIRDTSGQVKGLVLSLVDVTEAKRTKELIVTLNNINTAINSTLNFGEIMQKVVTEATKAIGCETGAISLIENNKWVIKYVCGLPKKLVGMRLSDEDIPHAALAAKMKKPVVINDTCNDARVNLSLMMKYSIRSVLVVPLTEKNDVIGTLFFNYHSKRVEFSDAQVDFALKLAVSVSLALENARLYEELKKHRSHLEGLVEERTRELKIANELLQWEIAERIKTEKVLRERQKQLRQITDNMFDMITQIDPQGIIQYCSPSVTKILGYQPESMLGKSVFDYVHPGDLDKVVDALFRPFINGRVPVKMDFRYRHADGHYLWLESVGNLLFNEKNAITGAIISTRDITKRKQLEREVARLERLNLVGEIAAGIGHEIRNPLTTVRGFLQMLEGKDGCGQYKEYFCLMIEELDRANSIIKEFLSLAKDKTVKLRVQSLNSIIRAIHPLIQADAMLSNNSINLQLEDIPDLLLDEKEIRQLLLNLVRNGLEAMPSGGNLIIRTFMDGENVVLSIQDEGKGIDPLLFEKLGTPFVTTKDQGTGLGLAVCYSIASRHNAAIEVKTGSTGTTFFVRFNIQ